MRFINIIDGKTKEKIMAGEDEAETIRLYIGNISKQLSDNLTPLVDRLERFGKLNSEIELKCKETFQDVNYFGFVQINISPNQFKKLSAAFHKVKFMNSMLVIQKAKP